MRDLSKFGSLVCVCVFLFSFMVDWWQQKKSTKAGSTQNETLLIFFRFQNFLQKKMRVQLECSAAIEKSMTKAINRRNI